MSPTGIFSFSPMSAKECIRAVFTLRGCELIVDSVSAAIGKPGDDDAKKEISKSITFIPARRVFSFSAEAQNPAIVELSPAQLDLSAFCSQSDRTCMWYTDMINAEKRVLKRIREACTPGANTLRHMLPPELCDRIVGFLAYDIIMEESENSPILSRDFLPTPPILDEKRRILRWFVETMGSASY